MWARQNYAQILYTYYPWGVLGLFDRFQIWGKSWDILNIESSFDQLILTKVYRV